MSSRFETITNRRAIIDRRALADVLTALEGKDLRAQVVAVLKPALEAGRAEIARRHDADDRGRR